MTNNQPANLFLIPSFISQDLSPDGVHLTAVSGLHYLLHLFDQSEAILALDPREPELKLVKVQESVRQHDDRLSYLESRHGGLHESVCLKTAIDHEFKVERKLHGAAPSGLRKGPGGGATPHHGRRA